MSEMSIVRRNLLVFPGYAPYCGNAFCSDMPRTKFDGKQFDCGSCGWRSAFPEDFIAEYKSRLAERRERQGAGND